MARKSLVATAVGIAAVAAPSAFADNGGIPHDGSNGQGRPATQQQTAASAPQRRALAKGHARPHAHANGRANGHARSHTTGPAPAKGHANGHAATPATQGPPASNTHAKAGKTTICHATGSATNPYVTITISNNAIPAHQRHQDGRDIIPAPQSGCPSTVQESQTQPNAATRQLSGSRAQTAAPAPQAATAPADLDKGQVLGASVTGSSNAATPATIRVLGATTSGGSPSASASPAATATRAASSSRLPFTGADVIIVAILGLAALLLGVTVRRASALKS